MEEICSAAKIYIAPDFFVNLNHKSMRENPVESGMTAIKLPQVVSPAHIALFVWGISHPNWQPALARGDQHLQLWGWMDACCAEQPTWATLGKGDTVVGTAQPISSNTNSSVWAGRLPALNLSGLRFHTEANKARMPFACPARTQVLRTI